MKKCNVCGRELPESEFYKNPNGTLRAACKKCHNERQRRYREENEKIAAAGFTPAHPVSEDTANLVRYLKNREDFRLQDHFTPRELMCALYARGYRGTLTIEQTVTLMAK